MSANASLPLYAAGYNAAQAVIDDLQARLQAAEAQRDQAVRVSIDDNEELQRVDERLQAERELRGRLAGALENRSVRYHTHTKRAQRTPFDVLDHRDPWDTCPVEPCLSDRTLIQEAAQAEEASDA